MKRDIMQIMGKRIRSSKEMIAYHGHPGADEITVIPPGQPSPVIKSYILRNDGKDGYFATESEGQLDWYIFDSESVQVVRPDAKDTSSYYGQVNSALGGLFYNTEKWFGNQEQYLSEGAQQAFDDFKVTTFDIAQYAKKAGIIIVALIALLIISKFS